MHWLELTVQTHPEAIESVSELLNRYTTGGIAIEEPIELIDEGQEYRVLAGHASKWPRAYGTFPAWDPNLSATCKPA
jgi:ribosomal protein L11 methyltransferase